jgi:hypothetical protein
MDTNESASSEITILPDGRVLILGASREVLDVLQVLCRDDPVLQRRLSRRCESADANPAGQPADVAKILNRSTNAITEPSQP